MEGEILNAINHVKNISKKHATFSKILLLMKKTYKNLTENELWSNIVNMVDKTIIVFHQRTKSYTVPDFSEDTVLVEQTQGTDEDATQIPSQDMKIILKKLSFRMNNMKLMATI